MNSRTVKRIFKSYRTPRNRDTKNAKITMKKMDTKCRLKTLFSGGIARDVIPGTFPLNKIVEKI